VFSQENRWEPADTQDPDVARVHELFEDMAKVTVPEVRPRGFTTACPLTG